MGISRVMVPGYRSLLAISCLFCVASASICHQGKQYLSVKLQTCVNCTECVKGNVVLFPCEIHRDTICGPISDVLEDVLKPVNHHRHKHRQRQHHKGGAINNEEKIVWTYGDDVRERTDDDTVAAAASPLEVTSTEAPFSSAETLVWDWQAIALTSAVFACILFFLAITLYSLHQAKQWRRLKDNFDADVEELSARLSLMAATSSEKGEILEPRVGPISDGNYLNNRCVYLEQLLNVRKDIKIGSDNSGGNVYIEESSSSPTNGGKT